MKADEPRNLKADVCLESLGNTIPKRYQFIHTAPSLNGLWVSLRLNAVKFSFGDLLTTAVFLLYYSLPKGSVASEAH